MKRIPCLAIFILLALSMLACSQFTLLAGGGAETVGSGKLAEETRPLGSLKGVSLDTVGHLEIQIGGENSLRIEADDNLLPLLESVVQNGVLHIRTKPGTNFSTRNEIRYTLTVPARTLERIEATSAGEISAPDLQAGQMSVAVQSSGRVTLGDLTAGSFDLVLGSSGAFEMGALQADRLTVKILSSGSATLAGGQVGELQAELSSSGGFFASELDAISSESIEITSNSSGDFQLRDLQASSLAVRLNSDGSVELRSVQADTLTATLISSGGLEIAGGQVREQKVILESSGAYLAGALVSQRAEVEIRGSGNARIHVSDSLTARLSSSGNLEYSGDPQVDQESTSSGKVVRVR